MSKSEEIINPLQTAYHAIEEVEKVRMRDKIIDKTGISLPQFYVIVRNGRAKKLQRKVFSRVLGISESLLFPESVK